MLSIILSIISLCCSVASIIFMSMSIYNTYKTEKITKEIIKTRSEWKK